MLLEGLQKTMTKIRDAKEKLKQIISDKSYAKQFGIGGSKESPALILYVNKITPKVISEIPIEIDGFEVQIKEMPGTIKPL